MTTKPKAEKAPETDEPIKVEVDGIKLTVDPNTLDDMDYMETLAEVDSGNASAFPAALRGLVGDDGYTAIREHMVATHGRFPVTEGVQMFHRVIEEVKAKNS